MADLLIAELQSESQATARMLRALPEERFSWKPHERSMSAGGLAKHIASLPRGIIKMVGADSFDVRDINPVFDPCRSSQELMSLFESCLESALDALGKMSPEDAAAPWRLMDGEKLIFELPKAAVVRTLLLNHLYHHRGQLSVYLRLLEVPVPSTYGPSADTEPRS